MLGTESSVMRATFSVIIAAASLLITRPALSHHSFAAEFDVNRPIQLTGTVTRIEWTNPHAWIFIETTDDDGNAQDWAIELLGINSLLRRGWTRDRVKIGDSIDVAGFGARDGTNTGNASTITLANTGELLWESA